MNSIGIGSGVGVSFSPLLGGLLDTVTFAFTSDPAQELFEGDTPSFLPTNFTSTGGTIVSAVVQVLDDGAWVDLAGAVVEGQSVSVLVTDDASNSQRFTVDDYVAPIATFANGVLTLAPGATGTLDYVNDADSPVYPGVTWTIPAVEAVGEYVKLADGLLSLDGTTVTLTPPIFALKDDTTFGTLSYTVMADDVAVSPQPAMTADADGLLTFDIGSTTGIIDVDWSVDIGSTPGVTGTTPSFTIASAFTPNLVDNNGTGFLQNTGLFAGSVSRFGLACGFVVKSTTPQSSRLVDVSDFVMRFVGNPASRIRTILTWTGAPAYDNNPGVAFAADDVVNIIFAADGDGDTIFALRVNDGAWTQVGSTVAATGGTIDLSVGLFTYLASNGGGSLTDVDTSSLVFWVGGDAVDPLSSTVQDAFFDASGDVADPADFAALFAGMGSSPDARVVSNGDAAELTAGTNNGTAGDLTPGGTFTDA